MTAIRSDEPPITYQDIMRLRGVKRERAKEIFRQIGRVAGIKPYEPRTMRHYQLWTKWRINQRQQKQKKK